MLWGRDDPTLVCLALNSCDTARKGLNDDIKGTCYSFLIPENLQLNTYELKQR